MANKIIEELKNNLVTIKEKFKVKEIGVFGSWIRGEAKGKGDVDRKKDIYESVRCLLFTNYVKEFKKYYYEERGIIISQQFEIFMKKKLKRRGR